MKLQQAIEILKWHNEWRRGADIPMTDPKILGEAIDCLTDFDVRFESIAQAYETGFAQGQEVGKREAIDKACDWLEYHEGDLVVFMGDATTDAIEEFRNDMEGISGNEKEIPTKACNSDKNLQELTWQDVQRIVKIADDERLLQHCSEFCSTQEQYYTEVLKQFNIND